MRILYCSQVYWPQIGGMELLALRLLPSLQQHGHEFLVVAGPDPAGGTEVTEVLGIPVHRFDFHRTLWKRDLTGIARIRGALGRIRHSFRPQLLHQQVPGFDAWFHLQAAGVPRLLTLHTTLADHRAEADTFVGQLLRSADWITAVSRSTLDDAARLLPEVLERSSVLYSGLPPPPVAPGPLRLAPPRILGLGRMVPEKGFDVAVQAFGSVLQRRPDARMILAGDGPARPELQRLTARLGLTDSVELRGWVQPEAVPALLNEAGVVVVPSRWREPFPLTAIEAAQMGRPVVASRTGGLPESVVDGRTGVLVEPDDPAALAEALLALLEHPEQTVRMGQAARARALDLYALQRCTDAYDQLYRRLGGECDV
jgi:glycogen(starch) synthase